MLEEILEAIDRKENLLKLFERIRGDLSDRVKQDLAAEAEILNDAELKEFSRKIRIYYFLSCFEETYRDSCFSTISNAILSSAVKGTDV